MVVDVCTYNGEKELWDIHYNVLKDYVDEFIVVEFDKTFSGIDKPSTFPTTEYPEVKYYLVGEDYYSKYKDLAESSPNTQGAEHWKREFMQKESIKDALTHLSDDDIVFIGDVDEVWNPAILSRVRGWLKDALKNVYNVFKLDLLVYTYWLNNRSSEKFRGTLLATYRDIKGETLNHLRADPNKYYHITFADTAYTRIPQGWHFTSQGGYNAVDKKLKDSYTEETYYNQWVKDNLQQNIAQNKDFLGRDFQYVIDESDWPQYLKDKKHKYLHLCRTAS